MRYRRVVWVGIALLVWGCSHPVHSTGPQSVKPSSAPAGQGPVRRATATPSAVSSPAAPRTASPTVTPSASPAPTHAAALLPPPQKVPRLAPDAAPQILDVAVSETSVHSGDQVFGRVVTSSNVASVEARIGDYAVNLVKVGVGRFELTYTVGPLPWFVHGNFTMQVIARNTRGDMATRAIPLTVR